MKLRFIWIGKTKRAAMKDLIADYLERTRRFARVDLVELRDCSAAVNDVKQIVESEGKEILSRIESDPVVVALDERGRELDSIKLAEFMEKHRLAGTKQITFVLGGHCGLSDAVRKRADFALALSQMTLTHEMARVVLTEQIYRAFTIIHDLPYQR